MQIQSTTDYDMFLHYPGNRPINPLFVADLQKAIAQKNLLHENEILVFPSEIAGKYYIADGQHRLEAARGNGVEVFYKISENITLEDIVRMNAKRRQWTTKDYMESYIQQGNVEYQKLKDFSEKYGITISNAAEILTGQSHGVWSEFKAGTFKVIDMEKAEEVALILHLLRPYTENGAWRDREFIRAVRRASDQVSGEQLKAKIEASQATIKRSVSVRDYILQFEDALNWKRRTGDPIRLEY